MTGLPRVVCMGVVTVDAIALVERYAAADERVVAEDVIIAGGGPAATAAVVLARQGVPVAFVGRVGADASGEQAIRLLQDEGVDVSAVLRDAAVRTQASCVVVSRETASRAISTLEVPPLPPVERLHPRAAELIARAEWLHTDHLGFAPAAAFLRGLPPEARPRLSVDAGNPVADLDPSILDLYVPTAQSLARTFSRPSTPDGVAAAARQALALGARAVVATDGGNGSAAWWSDRFRPGEAAGEVAAPAFREVLFKSSLGAGDVFHGALLSAVVRGCGWADALKQANATAALSCRGLDGRSAVPDLDELRRRLGADV